MLRRRQEDAEFFDRLGEPSILDMVGETFFGRQRLMVWVSVVFGIVISHQIKRLELQIAQLAAEVRTALETR